MEKVNQVGKKKSITWDKNLQKEYKNRYNYLESNWFTGGGCWNNGKSNALASYAIYGISDNV